jgi:hypothetical protein
MATNPPVDPCGLFVDDEFFSQHKIDPDTLDYEYTRCFIIYATTGSNSIIDNVLMRDFTVNIKPVFDQEENLGTPKNSLEWDKVLKEFLNLPIPPIPSSSIAPLVESEKSIVLANNFPAPIRTALDFGLKRKTCVLIRLVGDFWTFSPRISPVTTKHNYGKQYYNLGRHWLNPATQQVEVPPQDADYPCVSFFSKKPCLNALNRKHGFSFNLELIMDIDGTEERLPITVDPDIENKGDS